MKDEYLIPINTKQPIENTIQFYNTNEGASIEVLRISKDGITANTNVPVDEAAQAILRALDGHIKQLTQRTAAEGEDTRIAWVALTNEESVELMHQVPHLTIGGLLAVEAKLKEKNGA